MSISIFFIFWTFTLFMKILHISTGQAGAGLCAEKIHRSLLSIGVNSRMLVYSKPKVMDDTIDAPYRKNNIFHWIVKVIRKVFRTFSIPLCENDKLILDSHKYHAFYSTPQTKLDITSHPWIEWADVIHLHWCNNFFNQPLFFNKIKNKPIVWTLHDENLFYGTAHYHDSILTEDKLEKKYFQLKHEMVATASNLSIVFLSQYFVDKFSKEQMFDGKKIFKINNAVDCSQFVVQDLKETRIKLGLPLNKKILLFVATSITDQHKGLNILSEAVTKLDDDDIIIVAIGNNDGYKGHSNVISLGKIYDPSILSQYYSASNAYILPSYQEAFSQSCIEALSCGIPTVAFPVGVCVDCINEENGYLCVDFTIEELKKGIKHVLKNKYDKLKIRSQVEGRFETSFIAQQYRTLYNELVNKF